MVTTIKASEPPPPGCALKGGHERIVLEAVPRRSWELGFGVRIGIKCQLYHSTVGSHSASLSLSLSARCGATGRGSVGSFHPPDSPWRALPHDTKSPRTFCLNPPKVQATVFLLRTPPQGREEGRCLTREQHGLCEEEVAGRILLKEKQVPCVEGPQGRRPRPEDPGRQALWDTGPREAMPPSMSLVVRAAGREQYSVSPTGT